MAERQWTVEQQQCINDHGGTLLVSAAAGSGKTSVLVQRILRKVTNEENPTDIDRLLVVTFTKAAAAEMKQRISAELTKCIAQRPRDLRLQRQQLALPRAAISTVDSFCSSLIRDNAYLLDISPKFKVAEQQQLVLLRREALQETLDDRYRQQDPAFLELATMLSNGKNDTLLMSTVERIYDFIQSHPYPEQWLSQTETIYDDSLPIRDTLWGKLILTQLTDTLHACVQLLHSAAALCEGDSVLCDKYLPSLQTDEVLFRNLAEDVGSGLPWDDCFARIQALKLTPLSPVRNCTDETAKQRITALRDEVRSQLESLGKLFCGTEEQCRQDLRDTREVILSLYETVRRFSRCFAEKKQAQNLLDFSDIEHYALKLLTEEDENGGHRPTALARELAQQYDEIMVDEYQDTNATQDALFSALSREESNLFYVGDVKQSIYGFRQAMPELFLNRRNAYAPYSGNQYPATITLGNNFRSRREVTDSVNFLFRQLMTEQTSGICYDEREELVCSAPSYEEKAGYETECLILDGTQLKAENMERDIAEARVIAQRIRHCKETLYISDKEGARPAQYGDFCILLRNKKGHAAAYREELERQGIPVLFDSDNGFFDTAEIRLALSLLRCVDNPLLDIPLTAVMLSPLYGFTPDDLAQIRLFRPASCLYISVCAARQNTENRDLAARCREFLHHLDLYRTLAASVTVDTLLRRLYEDTALPEHMGARIGGAARRENLQLLHDHCRRFEQNGFRGLSAFIRYVDRLREQGADLAGASSTTGGDAVRILSIHGSKGLEYPVVFLAGLGSQFNRESLTADLLLHPSLGAGIKRRDPVTFNHYVTLPHRGLSLAIRNDSRAEELRILYVAMTRAREKLYLILTQDRPQRKLDSLASALTKEEALTPFSVFNASSMADWILCALLRHPSAVHLRNRIGRENLPVLSAQTPWHIELCDPPVDLPHAVTDTVTAHADPALTAIIRDHMAYTYPHGALARIPAKLAASEAAHGQQIPEHIAHSRPAFMSSGGLTPSERGTALHTFMQFVSYEAAAVNTETEAQRLVTAGFLTPEQAASLDHTRLSAFFHSPLYARIARSPRCLREYHFTCRRHASVIDPSLPTDTGEFLVIQGIADCLFEEDGKLVIVDYKTDRVNTLGELAERYRPQLEIYREAIGKALELPVNECLLYSFSLNGTIAVT